MDQSKYQYERGYALGYAEGAREARASSFSAVGAACVVVSIVSCIFFACGV